MKLEKGTFGVYPVKVLKSLRRPTLQVTFLWICYHANQDGICWPSIKKLIEETCLSKYTLIKNIKELEKLGILAKNSRFDKDGRQNSNMYTVKIGDILDPGVKLLDGEGLKEDHELNTYELNKTISTNVDIVKKSCQISSQEDYRKINFLLDSIKKILEIEKFAEQTKWQRIYAHHCLKEFTQEEILKGARWIRENWEKKPVQMKTIFYGLREWKIRKETKPTVKSY